MASKIDERLSLTLTRIYDASPEEVWRAWTDPEALMQWFGPDAGKVSAAELDVRAGGRYHVAFSTLDGTQHDVSGVYREVQRGRKLVFTWAWKSTPERESLVSLTFRPMGDGTELIVRHEHFFDAEARDRHEGGWAGSLDKLERFLNRAD